MAIKIIIALLFSHQVNANICVFDKKIEKERIIINKKNEALINEFSKLQNVSAISFRTLSDLIKIKSPMIINWYKNRGIDPEKEPEKLALEWTKYFSKNFIIAVYPHNEGSINLEIEKLFQKLLDYNFPKKRQLQINEIFNAQKNNAIQFISGLNINESEKIKIIEKVNAIKLYWPNGLADSKFKTTPLEFIDWSLAYDPKTNEINIGINSPYYDTVNLKSALLHEIAHSFDSCRWSQSEKSNWPFENVGTCLRNYAQKRDDSQLDLLLKASRITNDEYNFFKNNPTCNNTKYPPFGVQADQLPEAFADWFSSEAMKESDVKSNLRSELCKDNNLNPGSSYLKNTDRVFKIYYANKNISKVLKHSSNYPACSN